MLVWAVWCYPDTCLELLKVIWSWAVFPDEEIIAAETPGASASKMAAMASKTRIEKKDTAAKQRQDCTCIVIPSGTR